MGRATPEERGETGVRTAEWFLFHQTIALTVSLSWAKAGLEPWGLPMVAAIVFAGVAGVPLVRRFVDHRPVAPPWKALAVFATLCLVMAIGLMRPSYADPEESLAYLDSKELERATATDPGSVLALVEDLRLFRAKVNDMRKQQAAGNPPTGRDRDEALAFFNLTLRKARGMTDSPVRELFEKYERNLRLERSSLLPATANPTTGWKRACLLALVLLQGILLYRYLTSRRLIRLLLGVLVVNGTLLAVAGTFQKLTYEPGDNVLEIWGIWNAPEPRYYFGSFTYKNHWSAFALLCLGSACGLALRRLQREGSGALRGSIAPLALTCAIVIAVTIPLSGSRSGTLLLSFFLLLLGTNLLWKFSKRFEGTRRHGIFLGGGGIAVALTAAVIWFGGNLHRETGREMLSNTSQQIEAVGRGDWPTRFYLWRDTWTMFADSPLWGWGLGSLLPVFPLYQSPELTAMREYGMEYAHRPYKPLIAHAHSDWLEQLAELGVAGTLLLLALPAAILWRRLRESGGHRLSPTSTWPMLACLLFVAYCMVDFPTRTPAALVLFTVTLAIVLKHAELDFRRARERRE